MSRSISWTVVVMVCALTAGLTAAEPELSLLPKVLLPPVEAAPGAGDFTIDPNEVFLGHSDLMSNVPANFNGLVVNDFLGANRFYNAGINGQGTRVSNIEAGHVWNGHETLGHISSF